MKTSIVIATIMLWAIGLLCSSWLAQANGYGPDQVGFAQSMMQATGVDLPSSSSGSNVGSLIADGWAYVELVISAVFLRFPNLWTGVWEWFYYLVIIPLNVGMVFSIVVIFRGGSNA